MSSGFAVSDAPSDDLFDDGASDGTAGSVAESCGVGCGYGPACARPGAERVSVAAITAAAIVLDGTLPEKPGRPVFRCVDRRWLKRACGLRCVVIGELSDKG